MSISILCPTRRRASLCRRMIESAAKTADNVTVYVAYSHFDSEDYLRELGDIKGIKIYSRQLPEGMPTVHKWNLLAEAAKENGHKLFMLGADDMVFSTPCWDTALIEHYNALENKVHVYSLRDSRDEDGTPHVIVTREWIDALGYAFPPIFLHWQLDTWAVDIAKYNSCFTHFKDYLLIHDKPSDTGKPDETHLHIRAQGWAHRDQWVAENCQHFLQLEKERLALCLGK